MDAAYYSVPKLARRLGVSVPAVYYWITSGWIPAPERPGGTSARLYSREAADAIEAWYLNRASAGLCRGSGAEDKQRRAIDELRNRAGRELPHPAGERTRALWNGSFIGK